MKKTYIYVNGELVEKGSKEHYEKLLAGIDFGVPLQQKSFDGEFQLDECATGACPVK